MMNRLALFSVVLFFPVDVRAQDREEALTPDAVIRFATREESAEVLGRRDLFSSELSIFDLQCRLRTSDAVTTEMLLEFTRQQALDWSDAEIRQLVPVVAALRGKLAPFRLALPPKVLLVLTTGEEEAGAAYCRSPAIILPRALCGQPADQLERILTHELFHILSRHDPEVRKVLYEVIGFRVCRPISLPPELCERKISNPDAPVVDCVMTWREEGREKHVAPVLLAKERFDPTARKSLFDYLQFRLLRVEPAGDGWRVAEQNGRVELIDPAQARAFHERIGANTRYIIHPDEILADNFVHLVSGTTNLPTPRIVEQMRNILARPPGQ